QRGAGGGGGPVTRAALDLLVRAASVLAHGDADLDQDLGVADGRLVRAAVELLHVNDALAGAAADHRRGAERSAHRAEVLGGIRLAERAPDRAAIAHGWVRDLVLGVADDREPLREQAGLEELPVAGERADADLAPLFAYVAQLSLERVDV